MSVKECFEKGMLKKIEPDSNRTSASLKLAAHYVERAKGNLELEYYDVVFLLAYSSMLQTARALLFADGVKERSHGCAAEYLREKFAVAGEGAAYSEMKDFVELFDNYRSQRHFVQYDGGAVSENNAVQALEDAKNFLKAAKKALKEV